MGIEKKRKMFTQLKQHFFIFCLDDFCLADLLIYFYLFQYSVTSVQLSFSQHTFPQHIFCFVHLEKLSDVDFTWDVPYQRLNGYYESYVSH